MGLTMKPPSLFCETCAEKTFFRHRRRGSSVRVALALILQVTSATAQLAVARALILIREALILTLSRWRRRGRYLRKGRRKSWSRRKEEEERAWRGENSAGSRKKKTWLEKCETSRGTTKLLLLLLLLLLFFSTGYYESALVGLHLCRRELLWNSGRVTRGNPDPELSRLRQGMWRPSSILPFFFFLLSFFLFSFFLFLLSLSGSISFFFLSFFFFFLLSLGLSRVTLPLRLPCQP